MYHCNYVFDHYSTKNRDICNQNLPNKLGFIQINPILSKPNK